jgi:hypothetical protein
MGGEPNRDGASVTASTTGSYTGIKVHHLSVLLGTSDSCTRSVRSSASTLREPSMVGAAAARFILGRVITIIWMGTSSTNTVVHVMHSYRWLSPRPSRRHCLLGDADYDHSGA